MAHLRRFSVFSAGENGSKGGPRLATDACVGFRPRGPDSLLRSMVTYLLTPLVPKWTILKGTLGVYKDTEKQCSPPMTAQGPRTPPLPIYVV